ncbi:hypothetical protein PVAP13_8KG265000 [Panicum virgatum]|uniref:Uncharacterized protein n=1 Tax=Panicum virgatum TaxID=38727 RepID=A0A8T0PPD7_PANVG|nr:hypothetical protein PVAP13_8KG265000 [Panicum virgatum]
MDGAHMTSLACQSCGLPCVRACVKIRRSPWTTRQRRGHRRGPWRVSHGGGAPTDAMARGQLLQASGSSWTRRSTTCGTATRAAGTPTTVRRRLVFIFNF